MGQAHSFSVCLSAAEEAANVRVGIRGGIVAIEVRRAGIVTVVGIAKAISTTQTTISGGIIVSISIACRCRSSNLKREHYQPFKVQL